MTDALADPWPAPTPATPVDAVVTVPGSKSLTNRELLLAALADGPSRLRRPLRARDTELMAAALRALGTDVRADGTDWVIAPAPLRGPARIDCGLAGTVMRFVPAAAALADGPVHFDGDPQARTRPMGAVLAALRELGVRVDGVAGGTLPFTVVGTGTVPGGAVTIDASASSQFVSALLLAGARYARGVDLRHVGRPVPSLPHIAMTVETLRARGVVVDDGRPDRWVVAPGTIQARDVTIEPDLSTAAPFLAAAAATGGRVLVPDWPEQTSQPGALLAGILARFGAEVARDGAGLAVAGRLPLRGVDLDLRAAGELTPVVAALAALAATPSRLTGIAHLRGHETDRLAALAAEIGRLGGDVSELPDGLAIRPRPLHGGAFRTYADHRMAMAGAVLGLVVPGVLVENVATTAKTLPDFAARWQALVRDRSAA